MTSMDQAPVDTEVVTDVLRELWSELLQQPQISDEANFFELGGHSMLANRLIVRARSRLGISLPMALLFGNPVFGDFAGRVLSIAAAGAAGTVEGAVRTGRTRGALSLQQQQLMRVERVLGPSPMNVVTSVMEVLSGPLDLARLGAAVLVVLARHPMLRTALTEADGGLEQVVAPVPKQPDDRMVVAIDLSGIPSSQLTRHTHRAVRRAHREPFDLAAGLLMRVLIIRRGVLSDLLVLQLHHLACDEVSRQIVLEDLQAAYLGGDSEVPAAIGETVTYLDYACWQGARIEEMIADSAPYWRNVVRRLAGRRPLPASDASALVPLNIERSRAEVETAVGSSLRRWAAAHGMTLFSAVAASLTLAIARAGVLGQVGLGTLLDNRADAALARTVGPLANSTLLALPVKPDTSMLALTRLVDGQVTAVRRWSNLPLEVLLAEASTDAAVPAHTLVDAVLVLTYEQDAAQGGPLGLRCIAEPQDSLMPIALSPVPTVFVRVHPEGGLSVIIEHPVGDRDAMAPVLEMMLRQIRCAAAEAANS